MKPRNFLQIKKNQKKKSSRPIKRHPFKREAPEQAEEVRMGLKIGSLSLFTPVCFNLKLPKKAE